MASLRSAILTYHSLDTSGSVISIAPQLFVRQMQWLAESGLQVVPLASIQETPGALALTFDDGYRNFMSHAWPILQNYRFPATLFVVSGYCGRTNDWSTRSRSIPKLDLMDWGELRRLSSESVEIGAHSVSHADLSRLDPGRVLNELRDSRASLEDKVGAPVRAFAYPYGVSTPAIRNLAREEFAVCCGTQLQYVTRDSDPADLPRVDVFYLRRLYGLRHLMDPGGRAYLGGRRLLRDLRARLRVADWS